MKLEWKDVNTGSLVALVFSAAFLAAPVSVLAEAQDAAQETYDGLVPVRDSQVEAAYVDPDADFSGYNKIMILDTYVAFKKGWQRDHKRAGSNISISTGDMEKIKAAVAELFREVFTEKLSEDGGYEIVEAAGDDVLLVRPAIIDLDITSPDTMRARLDGFHGK